MAHDQYQIPQSLSEPEARAEVESITRTIEQERAPYQHIKDIEARIFSYRETALAMEKKPRTWLGGLVFAPQNTNLRTLVDEESVLGGSLFGEGHRFWLDNKAQATVFHNDIADWYHMQPNPADPKNPIVLRFQTTPYSIHKLYNGVEYSLTIQDLEHFLAATEAYVGAVLPLYPLDRTINELQNDL